MSGKKNRAAGRKRSGFVIRMLAAGCLAAGLLVACGEETKTEKQGGLDTVSEEGQGTESVADEQTQETARQEEMTEPAGTEAAEAEDAGAARMREQFGEDCIAGQTFEVELSEYAQPVFFVPFAPSEENPVFRMQMIQNGEVLTEIDANVPKALEEAPFTSLDAVSFYDLNFDGNTDIVLIETYGDTSFASVYYGYDEDGSRFFVAQEQVSENLTAQVEELSVAGIRSFLTGGKKNGEFDDYQEAYRAVGRLCSLQNSEETFALLYIDEDETPELAAGMSGYYVSLYTFHDGTIYTLMNQWAYGAMGNHGYEYAPRQNSLRNYNADYAGAVLYTTYMQIGAGYTIDTIASVKTLNFDDVNGNGSPDEEEMGSVGLYCASYVDGREITAEEAAAYDKGEYEYLNGEMNLTQLEAALGQD